MISISWSKLELFNECPRCFYFELRHNVSRPGGYPLNLNNAIDRMMKVEMDLLREEHESGARIEVDGKEFMLSKNKNIEKWRLSSHGLNYRFSSSITLKGVIDDIWEDLNGNLIVVDFKSTASSTPMKHLPTWADKIVRQLSFYTYLLDKNGYDVADKSIVFFVVGKINSEGLLKNLEFDYRKFLIDNDFTWVDQTVEKAQEILNSNSIPKSGLNCTYCRFEARRELLG